MRPGRCLPGVLHRARFENRDAGAPIGGGLDSPRSSNYNDAQPIPARSAEGVRRRRQRQAIAGVMVFRASGRGAAEPSGAGIGMLTVLIAAVPN
jgi:hypothetical protein